LFRAHGADFPREPWAFGTLGSRTYQTLLRFTNLRYRLMPYI
jgi:alpha-D-xyloside xylohydrolase